MSLFLQALMHKRKYRKSTREDSRDQSAYSVSSALDAENVDAPAPDPGLFIQAHEADVLRGPHAAASARSLECRDLSVPTTPGDNGLIQWGPHPHDVDTAGPRELSKPLLWLDRYDVRLLLDDFPEPKSETTPSRPLSPSGWSDLPSDSEDTFFFSPDELEDYHREKRRRLVDRGREERLRALEAISGQEDDPDPWGGSDEEPDEAQKELIRRTAYHIISSPNPGQLEMRILANYGTDKRFAFLRGRWSRVWRTEKERARQQRAEEVKEMHSPTALASLGGLATYGDSDTDGEGPEAKPTEESEAATDPPRTQDSHGNEDDVKEARRARAREWSARRRAEQSLQSGTDQLISGPRV